MDFDDLDDIEDAQYVPEEYMSLITRSYRFPGRDTIPEKIRSSLPEDRELKVCLRVFAFTGVGDSYLNWELGPGRSAPPWLELATHEWPSHGTRDEEDCPTSLEALAEDAFKGLRATLQQHQPGGRFPGAPFAFIGHSVGALLLTALCKRLKDEMDLEPKAVVILDRAPPHMPLFNELGRQRKKEDPMAWLDEYVGNMNLKDEKAKWTWINDSELSNDTREVGFFTFNCDMLILRAEKNKFIDTYKDDTPEARSYYDKRCKIMFSSPESAMDFDFEQFDEWDKWCAHNITIEDIDAYHMSIKDHPKALELIWDFFSKVKAADPS